MRLLIEGPTGTLMEVSGNHAMLPYDDEERAQVFTSLTNALALLAGVTPRSADATGGVTDARFEGSERCQTGHKSGVVVLLSERRADPI